MKLPEAVALILKALEEREARAAAPTFVDVDKSEIITGNAAREAHRRGELRLFRIGKKLLAKTAELDSYIEKHEVKPTLVAVDAPDLDDIDNALGAGGVLKKTG